jgi:hypothetical protein
MSAEATAGSTHRCLQIQKNRWAGGPSGFSQNGGDDRDRTDDLHNAIVALFQLSYVPIRFGRDGRSGKAGRNQAGFSEKNDMRGT